MPTVSRPRSRTRSRKRRPGLHDYILTHKRNGYKPHLFRTASIATLLIGLVVLQSLYFAQVKLILPNTSFLASVLPSALIGLTNGDRASNNLPAVTEDATLDQAAQNAANDMAAKGYFAHVSPDGTTPWDWLTGVGYKYQYAGENLAVNFTDSDQVETAWMNSPTHRANILKPQYTKVGIGVANGMYQGKEATFVVQFFATPESATAPATEPSTPVQQGTPAKSGSGEIAIAPKTATQALAAKQQAVAAKPAEVLGAQSGQPAAQTPAQPEQVAPVGTQHNGFQTFVSEAVTSPTHTLLYILLTLMALVGAVFLVELSVKVRLTYLEMTGGGFALLAILAAVVIINVVMAPQVKIAAGTQPAAVEAGVSTI